MGAPYVEGRAAGGERALAGFPGAPVPEYQEPYLPVGAGSTVTGTGSGSGAGCAQALSVARARRAIRAVVRMGYSGFQGFQPGQHSGRARKLQTGPDERWGCPPM